MEVFKPFISVIVYFLVLQLVVCSLPADIDPVKWKMHIEIPVVNQQYILRDVIPEDVFSGLDILYGDSIFSGDTVTVVKKGRIQNVIEKRLGTIDTGVVEKPVGTLTLQKTPPVDVMFTFDSKISCNHLFETPLSSALRLNFQKDKHPEGLQSITFDDCSSEMRLNVVNRTECADLQDVTIVLLNQRDTIAAVHSVQIPARSEKNIQMSLAGKRICFPVIIGVAVTVSEGTILRPSDGIAIFFSFDQQVVSEAVLNDSFLNYSHIHAGTMKIADSLHLDAIDLEATDVYCDITCTSLSKIEVQGTIENAWKRDYAVRHDLQSVDQLDGTLDSAEFVGKMETDTLFKSYRNGHYHIDKSVQPMRIFPSWDNLTKRSHIEYNFMVRSIPENRLIQYRKDDLIVIKLIIPNFPFNRISGSFLKETELTCTKNMKFGFEWKPSITDSLKQAFRFRNAQLHLDLASDLPSGSCIDSLLVSVVMREQEPAGDSAVLENVFHTISSDSIHSATINFTDVFNNWPDTVTLNTRFILPSGTGVILQNSEARKIDFTSALAVTMTLDWSVSVPLCWNVTDTVRLELDTTWISLQADQVEWVKKLQDPQIRIYLNIANHTNMGFILHALGACGRYKNVLMALPDSLAGTNNDEYLNEKHLFSLFDENGLLVEPRGNESSAVLQMDKRVIDALLSQDSCLIRWFLTIPSKETDALLAADYCTLKATGIIEGIGNTDSLSNMDDW